MNPSKPKIYHNNLIYHLGLLTRRWRQVLDSEFQAVGLTDATWRPLLHLHMLGNGVRQKDLAGSIGIEGPSLVRLLDMLIAKGLILRSEDAADRRAKLLCLTQKGELLVVQIKETVSSLENKLLSPFSDSEIAQFGQFVLSLESIVSDARKQIKR
jgi:MarR family transcriptional regulator, transcriptional regulator for hemolysin